MKNKTLIILLVIPFIIGILTFVSYAIFENTVAIDILDISFDYFEGYGFKVDSVNTYELKATPVIDETKVLASGNDLVWTIDETSVENGIAEIIDDSLTKPEGSKTKFNLKAKKQGNATLTCSNEKGTRSKSFVATIYENGTIAIIPKRYASSGTSAYSYRKFGEFDPSYSSLDGELTHKVPTIEFSTKTFYEGIDPDEKVTITGCSNNLAIVGDKIEIRSARNDSSMSYFSVKSNINNGVTGTYYFDVVKGAYNVYSYSDLIKLTNKSTENHDLVMQTSLDRIDNVYKANADGTYSEDLLDSSKNVNLFGNYDFREQKFNYANEITRVETKFPMNFAIQYNEKNHANYETKITVGIDLKGNLYGNGYYINAHDLCFPRYGYLNKVYDVAHSYLKPYLGEGEGFDQNLTDMFRGPLSFVTIGEIDGQATIVKAFAEDNSLIYVENPNTTIDDILLRNYDDSIDDLNQINYTGTVLNMSQNDCKLLNSNLRNAKNVIRAYDANNLLIDNCVISRSSEFNLELGSNKYKAVNTSQNVKFDFSSFHSSGTFDEMLRKNTNENIMNYDDFADRFLGLSGETSLDSFQKVDIINTFKTLQNYLDVPEETFKEDERIKVNVNNTKFVDSGVFSIALQTLFNGPYLYCGMPSLLTTIGGGILTNFMLAPDNIAGTSYPVDLSITGNKTAFNDVKDITNMDINNLIYENISGMAQQFGVDISSMNLNIDEFFPMKNVLLNNAKDLIDEHYDRNLGRTTRSLNTCIAIYGGGKNYSTYQFGTGIDSSKYSNKIEVGLLDYVVRNSKGGSGLMEKALGALSKCVLFAAGFNSFYFVVNSKGK